MSRAALLAAALLAPGPVDFGRVQLGTAASRLLAVPAVAVHASGAGFSATLARGGVLVVFEPYEPREEERGVLVLTLRTGTRRVALRGAAVDTIAPTVTLHAPAAVRAGSAATVRFDASDNDLVRTCTLAVDGRVVARIAYPATGIRWRVPRGLRGVARLTLTAVDRSGNRASARASAAVH